MIYLLQDKKYRKILYEKSNKKIYIVVSIVISIIVTLLVLYFILPYKLIVIGDKDITINYGVDYEEKGAVVTKFIFDTNQNINI